MTASLTKLRIPFEKESKVFAAKILNLESLNEISKKWGLLMQTKMEQGSNNLLAPSKRFLPESSVLHGDTTVLARASAIKSPSKERNLLAYNEPYVCGEAFWAAKRQKFLSGILQIGATGGRWGPRSIKRTWEKAESWAHIRREAEGRRRG